MENTSDSFKPGPLLFCMKIERSVCYKVTDNNKTIIMIAHRLKTVRGADQILVLDDSHIVQRGTHAELIQQKGLYADFVSARQEAIGWKLAQ